MPTVEPHRDAHERAHRSAALSAASCLVAATAMALVGASAALSTAVQWLVLGALVSILLGAACECLRRLKYLTPRTDRNSLLELPFQLAADRAIFAYYQSLTESLVTISAYRDPIYRGVALDQLAALSQQLRQIAGGTLVFEGTETWRIVYEMLLRSPGLHRYRSVAWVKNRHYWQDEPGRQSMAVNFERHAAGAVAIERIAIIADQLWPADEPLPDERVRIWLHEQHQHGIDIRLLRASLLAGEPELIADIGIYGFRALGVQELDDACRTMRFRLTFDVEQVQAAEDRWRRLCVYATSYGVWLDQFELPV